MKKIYPVQDYPGYFLFFCPGCKCGHQFKTVHPAPTWGFNGDLEKPTVQGSVLVKSTRKEKQIICHSIITDGKIMFCADSTHALSGQTVELTDIDKIEQSHLYDSPFEEENK